MSYTIDIIDTTNPDVVLTVEKSGAKTIVLSWNGGDTKDPGIISSSLKFTMVDESNADGLYDTLYTGNETKYKVNVIHDATTNIIWQGFLLPDLYNEPYTNNVVMVDFEATDGLGRLKGKYLHEDFYNNEKSVLEIISACLRATGLELDLYFIPAIENTIIKDYNAIYINTTNFLNKTKKTDAYTILNNLLESMMCILYQADNRWYFEGVNLRQLRVINYKKYDANGNFIEIIEYTRLIKEHNALITPLLSIVPPYGVINVSQNVRPIALASTITKELNDGWAVPSGTNARVSATDWLGYGGFSAFAEAYEYQVQLEVTYGRQFTDLDTSKFIKLREKLYLQAGDKFHFSVDIGLVISNTVDLGNTEDVLAGTIIELLINDVLIKNIQISFLVNESSKTVEFDFVVQDSGLFDVKIYEPFLSLNQYFSLGLISRFVFNKLELKKLNDTEDIYIENIVNNEFTLVKSIDLPYGDGASGAGSIFQLSKLKTSNSYIIKDVTVKYPITFLDINYMVVNLHDANLIADNITNVYNNGVLLPDLEVIYNFNNGEEMVVKTANVITAGTVLEVFVYAINDVIGDRVTWEQWTDTLYQIEKTRYAQTVANIYRRMYNVAYFKIDMTLNRSVKFNDIITFPYKQDQNYIITNCNWNLDANETTVTAIKAYYLNDVVTNPTDNILPIVDAGQDVVLTNGVFEANLLAVASDPDGFIVSYFWEQISGVSVAVIQSVINAATNVSNLLGEGDYVFRVTVTDNEGATAFDEVTIRKNTAYVIDITEDCISDVVTSFGNPINQYIYNRRKILGVSISPVLPAGTSITLTFKITLFEIARNSVTDYNTYIGSPACVPPIALPPLWISGTRRDILNPAGYNTNLGLAVMKNGSLIYGAANGIYTNPDTIEVSMISTTDLFLVLDYGLDIYVSSLSQSLFGNKKNRRLELTNVVVNSGAGTFSGFPETIYAYNNFSPALITPNITTGTPTSSAVNLTLIDFNSASTETINIYIEYCENNGNDVWVVHGNVIRTATSYSVSGLNTATDYKIRCKAVVTLDVFESEYSNYLEIRTL